MWSGLSLCLSAIAKRFVTKSLNFDSVMRTFGLVLPEWRGRKEPGTPAQGVNPRIFSARGFAMRV
jgi:hypothetical protein